MAIHLTPEEVANEVGFDRATVIRLCVDTSVPIYKGKVDRTLLGAQLKAVGAQLTAN